MNKFQKIAKIKRAKPYFIIPLVLVIVIILLFISWVLTPKKVLNICLLDKTVPTANDNSAEDISAYYRKHQGFFWLLEQQKYVKNDKSYYDYKTDYFGPQLGEKNEVGDVKELSDIDFSPDLMYVADAYGSELYEREYRGISKDDMAVISLSHSNGATVIAEMETFYSTEDETVNSEMMNLCGVSQTTWVGRYIYELQDFSDVPEWAPPLYEQQEGVEWRFSGPGILLVSSKGKIIILEEKTDFISKNLMRISVNEDFEDKFSGCDSVNYYNWFELIETNYEIEVIASFDFNLNAVGMEKIAEISSTPRFAAVTRKNYTDKAPVYYFAGDFNDYVSKLNYNRFIFSDYIYRWISFDRSGDISNFYWNFYNPIVKEILKDVSNTAENSRHTAKTTSAPSRIYNNKFQVINDGKWTDFTIKGASINAQMPSDDPYEFTRDYSIYEQLIKQAGDMGINCLKAKDLLPPEFYRALYEYNIKNKDAPIYLVQNIIPPSDLSPSDYLTEKGLVEQNENIKNTLKAIHGEGYVPKTGDRAAQIYSHNVSAYLLCYIIDNNLAAADVMAVNASNSNYSYSGLIFSASNNPTEALIAQLCDSLYQYHTETYEYNVPIGAAGEAAILSGAKWNDSGVSFNVDNIKTDPVISTNYFFTSYALNAADKVLLNNSVEFARNYSGYAYGGYIDAVKRLSSKYPILIDSFGLSTNINTFEQEASINGLSEKDQGNGIVKMLKAIDENGYLGGIISDLNDGWGECSNEMYKYTIPIINKSLWKNLLDRSQTTGILAIDALPPAEVGMEINDSGRMQQLRFSSNEAYLYITVLLNKEIDYDKEQLFIGLDTYQRNDGEYLFDSNYYANSLSGMEFVLKFDSKTSAGLYVASSYNRNTANYSSKENYTADFKLINQMVYGNFSSSQTQFYQTGSTIYIRLPWSALGFTDPSQKVVMNQIGDNESSQVRTTTTNGILSYLFIGNKKTKDTVYIFPDTKESTGYKVYNFSKWEKANYEIRKKESFAILQKYFKEL